MRISRKHSMSSPVLVMMKGKDLPFLLLPSSCSFFFLRQSSDKPLLDCVSSVLNVFFPDSLLGSFFFGSSCYRSFPSIRLSYFSCSLISLSVCSNPSIIIMILHASLIASGSSLSFLFFLSSSSPYFD